MKWGTGELRPAESEGRSLLTKCTPPGSNSELHGTNTAGRNTQGPPETHPEGLRAQPSTTPGKVPAEASLLQPGIPQQELARTEPGGNRAGSVPGCVCRVS